MASEKLLHPAIQEHLARVGIIDDHAVTQFISPSMQELPSPWSLKDIDKAVNLIISKMELNQPILVWGDYDVDGISATALIVLYFRTIGYANIFYHIPNRLTEGYGINPEYIEILYQKLGPDVLLVSVDCGISNYDEIIHAKQLGWQVVVTDHHLMPDYEVPADAVVNPQQKDCQFPYKTVSGATVAFYLVAAIRSKIKETNSLSNTYISEVNLKQFLSFVSLGTVADVMPLNRVNRILVKAGFEAIADNKIHGINRLLTELDIDHSNIQSEKIAFSVAPTINAAGRLGKPEVALNALIQEKDADDPSVYKKLVSLNKKRKQVSNNDYDRARQQAESLPDGQRAIVIKGDFHDGILGITASRLAEEYLVPAIVFTIDKKNPHLLKGSGRAPEHFDLYCTLKRCAHYLTRFGGHRAAAGMSLENINFEVFRTFFSEQSIIEFEKEPVTTGNAIEPIYLPLEEAHNPLLLKNILQLEPTGEGNPKPIFYDSDVSFVSLKRFGQNFNHLRGVIRGRYKNLPFIGFNLKGLNRIVSDEPVYRFFYTPMFDQYNGSNTWKIRAMDIWQYHQT